MENLNDYKQFNENILNLSKKRKFPTLGERDGKVHKGSWGHSDVYSIYHLSKKDLGKYLNTWFVGEVVLGKYGDTLTDEMWTVKRVDKQTADNLYRKNINPIRIAIMCPTGARFKKDESGVITNYQMKAQIYSIDDSSYGVWFGDMKLEDLKKIRPQIMEWINDQDEVNGDEFIDFCLSLGADPDSVDYN